MVRAVALAIRTGCQCVFHPVEIVNAPDSQESGTAFAYSTRSRREHDHSAPGDCPRGTETVNEEVPS